VAERIPAAAVALGDYRLGVAGFLAGEAQLAGVYFWTYSGQRLSHPDREAVQTEVILVAVLGEPFARRLRVHRF
jgi:hypothetical protein